MDYTVDTEFIHDKCKKYTNLTDAEIDCLINLAKQLPYFAAINDTEAFLDVKIHNEDKALIIAEYFREESIYKHSFLGEPAFRYNEPAVFRALDLGMKTSDIACVSYDTVDGESILSKQTTIPIKSGTKVIGVLTLEKPMDAKVNLAIEAEKNLSTSLIKNENDDVIEEILGFKNEHSENRIREGILVFDEKGILIRINNTAKNIYALLGFRGIENLHFDNINLSSLTFSSAKRIVNHYEERVQIDQFFFSIRVAVERKQNTNIVVFIEDIT